MTPHTHTPTYTTHLHTHTNTRRIHREWRRAWKTFFINMNFLSDISFVLSFYFLRQHFWNFLAVFIILIIVSYFADALNWAMFCFALLRIFFLSLSLFLVHFAMMLFLSFLRRRGSCRTFSGNTWLKWGQLIGLGFHLLSLLTAQLLRHTGVLWVRGGVCVCVCVFPSISNSLNYFAALLFFVWANSKLIKRLKCEQIKLWKCRPGKWGCFQAH